MSASRFSVARADFELSVSERRRPKHRMNLVTRMFADYLALLFFITSKMKNGIGGCGGSMSFVGKLVKFNRSPSTSVAAATLLLH